MDPGSLDKLISLRAKVETGRDAARAPIIALQEFAKVWSRVTYTGGKEFLAGDGETKVRKVVFKIYPRDDVSTDTVVVFGAVEHDVQDVVIWDDAVELHAVAKPL